MNIHEALNLLGIEDLTVTQEELKKAYKRAAMKYHPDRNPQGEKMMKAINEAYDFLKALEVNPIQRNKNRKGEYDNIYDFGELLNNVLNILAHYDDLTLEVIGNWLWISGQTRGYIELLKDLNCRYAPKKKIWFFRPEEHKCLFNNKEQTLEHVRNSYGSWKYNNNKHKTAQEKGQKEISQQLKIA